MTDSKCVKMFYETDEGVAVALQAILHTVARTVLAS